MGTAIAMRRDYSSRELRRLATRVKEAARDEALPAFRKCKEQRRTADPSSGRLARRTSLPTLTCQARTAETSKSCRPASIT